MIKCPPSPEHSDEQRHGSQRLHNAARRTACARSPTKDLAGVRAGTSRFRWRHKGRRFLCPLPIFKYSIQEADKTEDITEPIIRTSNSQTNYDSRLQSQQDLRTAILTSGRSYGSEFGKLNPLLRFRPNRKQTVLRNNYCVWLFRRRIQVDPDSFTEGFSRRSVFKIRRSNFRGLRCKNKPRSIPKCSMSSTEY